MPVPPTEKPRALVAEDDRVLSDIIRLSLKKAGFDVTVAYDGRTARQLASTTAFDVVCSDYQMPHVNGEELLRSIRAAGPSRDARMVLCSAKVYELDSEKLIEELSLSGVLYKPFSLVELVRTLQAASPQGC